MMRQKLLTLWFLPQDLLNGVFGVFGLLVPHLAEKEQEFETEFAPVACLITKLAKANLRKQRLLNLYINMVLRTHFLFFFLPRFLAKATNVS